MNWWQWVLVVVGVLAILRIILGYLGAWWRNRGLTWDERLSDRLVLASSLAVDFQERLVQSMDNGKAIPLFRFTNLEKRFHELAIKQAKDVPIDSMPREVHLNREAVRMFELHAERLKAIRENRGDEARRIVDQLDSAYAEMGIVIVDFEEVGDFVESPRARPKTGRKTGRNTGRSGRRAGRPFHR